MAVAHDLRTVFKHEYSLSLRASSSLVFGWTYRLWMRASAYLNSELNNHSSAKQIASRGRDTTSLIGYEGTCSLEGDREPLDRRSQTSDKGQSWLVDWTGKSICFVNKMDT